MMHTIKIKSILQLKKAELDFAYVFLNNFFINKKVFLNFCCIIVSYIVLFEKLHVFELKIISPVYVYARATVCLGLLFAYNNFLSLFVKYSGLLSDNFILSLFKTMTKEKQEEIKNGLSAYKIKPFYNLGICLIFLQIIVAHLLLLFFYPLVILSCLIGNFFIVLINVSKIEQQLSSIKDFLSKFYTKNSKKTEQAETNWQMPEKIIDYKKIKEEQDYLSANNDNKKVARKNIL